MTARAARTSTPALEPKDAALVAAHDALREQAGLPPLHDLEAARAAGARLVRFIDLTDEVLRNRQAARDAMAEIRP